MLIQAYNNSGRIKPSGIISGDEIVARRNGNIIPFPL
jgi:NAD-dependent DNA ligase